MVEKTTNSPGFAGLWNIFQIATRQRFKSRDQREHGVQPSAIVGENRFAITLDTQPGQPSGAALFLRRCQKLYSMGFQVAAKIGAARTPFRGTAR
jgi:hypothetical protein